MIMQRRIAVSLTQAVSLLLLITFNLRASDPLDIWAWRNPLPVGNSFNGVTHAAGLIIGVGNCGAIMTSTNLTTDWWVRVPMGTNSATLNAIAYGAGTFVIAAGDSPDGDKTKRFLTSTDGTNWFVQTWPNANTRAVYGVTYGTNGAGDGLFVAVTERSGVWSSPDGTNWTQRIVDSSSSDHLYGITFAPDYGFVAAGTAGKVLTSPDGISWGTNTVTSARLTGITWGYVTNWDDTVTTNFLAVGYAGTILTSPDGTNWASHDSLVTANLSAAAFAPGVGYIALGAGAVIQYSTDGTNWNSSYSDISNPVNVPGNDFKGAVHVGDLGYFVAVGNYGEVETSPDGSPGSWTAAFVGRPENLTGVARGRTNFVVVGNSVPYPPNYGLALTSMDGSSWKVRNSATPASTKLNNVAYGAGVFVAVGNGGTIVTSENEGANWAAQSAGVSANLAGVSYITNSATNIFLATGAAGTILTSPDGTNWTAQTSGTGNALNCSCPTYAAGVYVVGGASGTILTSPDATTWTPGTSGISRDIYGLAYGNDNFVAACNYGYILTSSDGTTWSRQTSPLGSDSSSSRAYNAIIYVNGQFVLASSSSFPPSAILTSPNGTNWTIIAKPQSSASFKALAYAPNTYLGVGNYGMIMQAGSLAVEAPQIEYTYASGTLTLIWSGGGILLASPDVAGTYTNVPGATSPWPIAPLSEPSLYFRVQHP